MQDFAPATPEALSRLLGPLPSQIHMVFEFYFVHSKVLDDLGLLSEHVVGEAFEHFIARPTGRPARFWEAGCVCVY
jgi:hypothetical protein